MSKSNPSRKALLNTLCRICGKKEKNTIPVFSENGKKQNIELKIRLCLPLTIEKDDGLPKQICLTCLNKLDGAWELFQLCKEGKSRIEEKLFLLTENQKPVMPPEVCPICKNEVSNGQHGICCDGVCQMWHHRVCVNMTELQYLHLVCHKSVPWICPSCDSLSFPDNQVIKQEESIVNDKVKLLDEKHPITIGNSTIVMLVPKTQPKAMVEMVPAFQVATPATSSNMPEHVTSDNTSVYPQGLIQVLPSNETVIYHPTNNTANNTSHPTPTRVHTPAKKRQRRSHVKPQQSLQPSSNNKNLKQCNICKQQFPDDIIDHHVSLHFKRSFFSCIDCNKNFRSEEAMSRHRCQATNPPTTPTSNSTTTIDLDAEDEDLIML